MINNIAIRLELKGMRRYRKFCCYIRLLFRGGEKGLKPMALLFKTPLFRES